MSEPIQVTSQGTQVPESSLECFCKETQTETMELVPIPPESPIPPDTDTVSKISNIVQRLGIPLDVAAFVHSSGLSLQSSGPPPQVHGHATRSWDRHYTVLSFLMNGHLHAEYSKLSGMLGLPSCSMPTWLNILEELEKCVTELAEWSCNCVREAIKTRGDHQKWVASFDGFYLTRGHHSNNCSATMHDYATGDIAWFCHRTKRGKGHNWEGTSGGAEGDMFNELIGNAKNEGFIVSEIITDKDSAMNSIYCKHFPEGTITYCANHCAKAMHKDLGKIKIIKCEVSITVMMVFF